MRPDFEHMTIAELRAYCSYIRKVGVDAHKVLSGLSDIVASDSFHKELVTEANSITNKLEVLGLSSKSDNQKGD